MEESLKETLGSEFEVLRPLGVGSQGRVFLAREVPLDRLVAVKVLSTSLMDDEVAKARFMREAKAAASLNHPNAISVHRFGFLTNGQPYLVMQFASGRTLEERVEAEGPLALEEGRRIIGEIAGALASAHAHGFIHRDVNPGNVLCDQESGRTLLTDFGVAGILPSGKDQGPRLTQAGELLGDIRHMSPERVEGADATEASDIYALGVMGYWILSGQGPYPDQPPARMIRAHLKEEPRPLSALRNPVDPDVESLLARCLSKDPARRPSAAFLAETLTRPVDPKADSANREGEANGDVLRSLLEKRFPQIVVATAVGGGVMLGGVSQLVEMQVLGLVAYHLALPTYLSLVAASGIIAWFHGARGRQETGAPEIILLSILGALWIGICAFILLV